MFQGEYASELRYKIHFVPTIYVPVFAKMLCSGTKFCPRNMRVTDKIVSDGLNTSKIFAEKIHPSILSSILQHIIFVSLLIQIHRPHQGN